MKIDRSVLVGGAAALSVLVAGLVAIVVTRGSRRPPIVSGQQLVLVGDSLGVGMTGPLAILLADAGVSVVSLAHVGWTARQTAQLLATTDVTGSAWVASLGSNDAALSDPSSEAADVQAIVDTAFARGAQRFVLVVPPNYSIPSPPAPATTEKQQAFLALWSDPRVERVYASPDKLGADRIHLPPAGYAELAASVAAVLTR